MKSASPARVSGLCEVPLEFVTARLHGRRSRLHEGERLLDLARTGSVADLAWRLFPGEDVPDPFALERRLRSACTADLSHTAGHLHGRLGELYRTLLSRYVVENVKTVLRLTGGAVPPEERERYLIGLPPELALSLDDLESGRGMADFIERIPLPAVRQSASAVLPLYEETGLRAYMEMAVDRGYWLSVREAVDGMPRGMQAECAAPVRAESDMILILSTLRAARIYGIPWEHWELLAPAGPSSLDGTAVHRLHDDPDPEAAVRRLPPPAVRDLPEDPGDLGRLEEALWNRTVAAADRQFYRIGTGPAVVIGYYYVKRQELRHLLGLTQMLRYSKTANEIVDYLGL